MKKITAGVAGGAGYTGGEVIRLLLHHPQTDLKAVISRSQDGKKISDTHRDLQGETELKFSSAFSDYPDVLFLCLNHGESKDYMAKNPIPPSTRVIDMGNDFRLDGKAGNRTFVYGLPEFQREEIKKADAIANPGCFATTIQLGLLPLAQKGLLDEVHAVGVTGSTGAGQKPTDTSHFSWRANNISPYKTLTHQHIPEIRRTLKSLQQSVPEIRFVPWRGDFTRGIFVSSMMKTNLSLNELHALFKDYYKSHPFAIVSNEMIDLKPTVNTNKCFLFLEKEKDCLVVHSALDNLLKGAAGQAVQNMNLMFGFDETLGLRLKAGAF